MIRSNSAYRLKHLAEKPLYDTIGNNFSQTNRASHPFMEICESLQYSQSHQCKFVFLMSLPVICFLTQVVQTIEDHHQEVIALFRENGFHGLVAYDSDYALCNIPYYFSAHALKLSRNGKSLTTSQYLMHEVAKQLNLNPNRFVIFASLLGRFVGLPVCFQVKRTSTLALFA